IAVFADAYGMTARQRAGLTPLAIDMVRRYREDSRTADVLSRSGAWLRKMAPAIAARLVQPG
ncbi:MAG: phosphotransferase enzyme family protein, partial [Stackebrandtia sp.]